MNLLLFALILCVVCVEARFKVVVVGDSNAENLGKKLARFVATIKDNGSRNPLTRLVTNSQVGWVSRLGKSVITDWERWNLSAVHNSNAVIISDARFFGRDIEENFPLRNNLDELLRFITVRHGVSRVFLMTSFLNGYKKERAAKLAGDGSLSIRRLKTALYECPLGADVSRIVFLLDANELVCPAPRIVNDKYRCPREAHGLKDVIPDGTHPGETTTAFIAANIFDALLTFNSYIVSDFYDNIDQYVDLMEIRDNEYIDGFRKDMVRMAGNKSLHFY